MNGLEILVGGLVLTILVLTIGLTSLARKYERLKKERK